MERDGDVDGALDDDVLDDGVAAAGSVLLVDGVGDGSTACVDDGDGDEGDPPPDDAREG